MIRLIERNGCTSESIGGGGGEGSTVFLQRFIDNLPAVKLCRPVSRLEHKKWLKVLSHVRTQMRLKSHSYF